MTQSMHEAPRLPSPAEPLCLLAMGHVAATAILIKQRRSLKEEMTECWDKQVPLSTRFESDARGMCAGH